MIAALERLVATLQSLVEVLEKKGMSEKAETLYQIAYDSIGLDVSPQDLAPDELACVESLCKIIQVALPELNFPLMVGTRELFDHLSRSPSFKGAISPMKGDIILSITGTGNGSVKNGHTGIVGKNWIMSNDSRTGTWQANYLLRNWRRYFEGKGGMTTFFFRLN